MILSLNCARGEPATCAVLSFVLNSLNYYVLLLQEPWLNNNNEPPPIWGFEMFLPTPTNAKYVTYIRGSALLHPTLVLNEADCLLDTRIRLNPAAPSGPAKPRKCTIYNLYSLRRQQVVCHFFLAFCPDANAKVCRDFNSHHRLWYRHRANQHQHLMNEAKLADGLVERPVNLSLGLRNQYGYRAGLTTAASRLFCWGLEDGCRGYASQIGEKGECYE